MESGKNESELRKAWRKLVYMETMEKKRIMKLENKKRFMRRLKLAEQIIRKLEYEKQK